MEGRKNAVIPGYIVVKFPVEVANQIDSGAQPRLAQHGNATYVKQIPNSGWTLWKYPELLNYNAVAQSFRNDPSVITYEPLNKIYTMWTDPNDGDWNAIESSDTFILYFGDGEPPTFKRLWHLDDISAQTGWTAYPNTWFTSSTKSKTSPLIAIVDTGCDMNHPDFMNAGATSTDVADGGQLQKNRSKQFSGGVPSNHGTPEDHNGHGTHVTGLALAAGNNGSYTGHGVIGTGYMCRGMILRVFDNSGNGTDFDAAGAMYYAADKKAAVINLSLGTENFSQLFQDASTYAFQKGSVVVAAGNEDGSGGGDLGPIYPAGCSGVLGVSADGPDQIPASGSYSGTGMYVDVAAPGGDIVQPDEVTFILQYVFSTSMETRGDLENQSDQGIIYPPYTRNYSYLLGTSMASPQVAGAAGAYMALKNWKQGQWKNTEVYKAIEKSADGVMGAGHGGWEPYQGYGALDMGTLLTDTTTRNANYGSVEGIVYSNATAIANVAVTAQKLVNGVPTGFKFSTSTNQHGYYRFDSFPTGLYLVTSAPNGLVKSKQVTIEAGCDTTGFDFWCGTYTGDTSGPGANNLKVVSCVGGKLNYQHWAYDTETGIDEISYRIGTTAGGSQVVGDTVLGTRTFLQKLTGLPLTPGVTYYLREKYTNGNGDTATRSVSFVAG